MNSWTRRVGKACLWVIGRVPHAVLAIIDAHIVRKTGNLPLFPVERLTWREEVEAAYPEIREEVARLSTHLTHVPTVHDILPMTHLSYSERDWRQLFFHLYGSWIDDNCERYPTVARTLRLIPGLRNASLSVLRPGETIPPHEHIYKGFLIFHLPIIVPTDGDCAIRIADETVRWKEGELIAIDPTQNHEVWNNTSAYRVLLLGEFSRPGLPSWYQWLDRFYMAVFNLSPAGKVMLRRIRESAAKHRAELDEESSPDATTVGSSPA